MRQPCLIPAPLAVASALAALIVQGGEGEAGQTTIHAVKEEDFAYSDHVVLF